MTREIQVSMQVYKEVRGVETTPAPEAGTGVEEEELILQQQWINDHSNILCILINPGSFTKSRCTITLSMKWIDVRIFQILGNI